MRRISRHALTLPLAAALFLGGLGTAWLRGEGDDDDLVEIRGEQKGQIAFGNVGRMMISERNIDGWIYGNESRGRDWLEASLKQRVDELAKTCSLSETQRRKLNLAGEGDIQRFETRVAELKTKCHSGAIRPNEWNAMFQKTQPLRAELQRGLFGGGSLFHKTLLTALRPEQAALGEQIDRERRNYRYRARVELCVAQLDGVVGLRDEQRRRLVQLILDKTRPPKSFGQFERFIVLVQMSRLPENTLKPVFEPAQWPEVHKRLAQARRMIPALKQNGVVFDDDPEPAKDTDGASTSIQVERLRN
jgi:hypothetical protein